MNKRPTSTNLKTTNTPVKTGVRPSPTLVKPVVVKPFKPIVSPPAPPAPPDPKTDLKVIQAIADATFSAAKMPAKYSIFDLPNYIAYLVAYKSGKNLAEPVPVEVPTDVKNDNGQLSMLVMLLMAAGQAAGMPTAQGNVNARIYTMKDLPSWITSLKL